MLDTWTFVDTEPTETIPIGEYQYREGRLSGTASLGENPQATRIFLVDWEQHAEFCDDLLGYSLPPTSVGGKLQRTLPEEHPDYHYFYATDVQVQPLGLPTTTTKKSNWKIAQITTTYKPLPYGVYADETVETELERYVSVQTMSMAEYLSANNVGMQFVSRTTNKAVQMSPGIVVPSVVMSYTWHDLPAPSTATGKLAEFKPPNLSLFTRLIGSTNYTTFDGHPPQTMALIAVTPERLMPRLSDGLYRYNVTYTFDVRNRGEDDAVGGDTHAGVNYIYDLANQRWDLITTTGTTGGARLFRTAEFADLFRWGVE